MKLKPIIPIVLMISAPIMGMGQNKSGLVMSNLDKTVKRYGSFDQLQENNSKRINTILSDLEKKKYATGTIEQKLSDFYKLALNVERRNTEGTAPVAALLNEIESASTVAQLRELQLKYAAQGYGVQYASYFGADSKNVSMNIMHISQSGLTLEQKDYYLNNDAATVAIREAFRKHIARMFGLYGFDAAQAQKKSDAGFRLEAILALWSMRGAERRGPAAHWDRRGVRACGGP